MSIFIVCRAVAGKNERNRRAVFALGENGLKTVDISVMNLVIMVAVERVLSVSLAGCHPNKERLQSTYLWDCDRTVLCSCFSSRQLMSTKASWKFPYILMSRREIPCQPCKATFLNLKLLGTK